MSADSRSASPTNYGFENPGSLCLKRKEIVCGDRALSQRSCGLRGDEFQVRSQAPGYRVPRTSVHSALILTKGILAGVSGFAHTLERCAVLSLGCAPTLDRQTIGRVKKDVSNGEISLSVIRTIFPHLVSRRPIAFATQVLERRLVFNQSA